MSFTCTAHRYTNTQGVPISTQTCTDERPNLYRSSDPKSLLRKTKSAHERRPSGRRTRSLTLTRSLS